MMKFEHNPALDGLRAVAALMVIAYHSGAPFAGGGFVGVDVFFVLSGFLITSLLRQEIETGGIDYGQFLLRRAVRLFPALALLLTVWLIVGPILWPAEQHVRDAVVTAAYLSNLASALWDAPGRFLNHTWSLASEQQFYLLWPLLLPLFAKRRNPALWLCALYVALAAWRLVAPWPLSYFCHTSGLALGATLAFTPPAKSSWLGLPGLLLIALAVTRTTWAPPFPGILLAEVGTALILLHRRPSLLNTALASRPLVSLGLISYGVYLWQQFFIMGLQGLPWTERLAISLPGSLAAAWLSYTFVEQPIRRWAVVRRTEDARTVTEKVGG